MCGIAGALYASAPRGVERGFLQRMAGVLAHRGPDGQGVWPGPGVGLAHRRLSIIDLEGGAQPMANEDGSVRVVFNGEIYNYRQLQRQLKSRGHRFATDSDTEVLVHLYEEHGEALVERLRGMFAFALWDGRKRHLLLARDRVGQKPLYYYRDAEKLVFASEIKAILAYPGVEREIDPQAVEDYFTLGVIPGERSIFRSIRKLRAGHVLSVSRENFQASPRRYWQLRIEPQENDADTWIEALDAKIAETVRVHTVADVPLGAFLSGGLDSSAIVCSLAGLGNSVRTFSVGFEEEAFSELPYARQVARQFQTEHTEEIVTPEAVQGLTDLVRHFDEPFADASAIPTMWISRAARQHVKVILSGDGGDEAFGGYARYGHDLREAAIRRWIPRWLRRSLLASVARCWPNTDWLPRPLRAKTTLTNLSLDAADAYANTLDLTSPGLRAQLLNGDVRGALNGHDSRGLVRRAYREKGDALAGMIGADVELLLPDDFLTKVDRASMACGLEVRPPFVDHELLETAARVPSRFKVRRGETKWALKRLFAERLPHDVVWRRKQGFDIPRDRWLAGPLREMFETLVLARQSRIAGWVNQSTARRLYRAHLRVPGRHGAVLWALLILGRWLEEYASPIATPSATPSTITASPTAASA